MAACRKLRPVVGEAPGAALRERSVPETRRAAPGHTWPFKRPSLISGGRTPAAGEAQINSRLLLLRNALTKKPLRICRDSELHMIRTFLSELIKEMRLAAAELTKAADGLEKLVHFAGNGTGKPAPLKGSREKASGIETMEELERRAIQQALEQTNGNQSEAARLLGVGRDQFRYRMARHKLGNASLAERKNGTKLKKSSRR